MIIKIISTEKALKLVETENTLMFNVDRSATKDELKKEIEKLFKVKVEKIRTHIKRNEKIAFIKLKKENPAIDIATKLGLM